ncbi:MAG: hypothetical protein HY741_29150 [Chloroflexi bacterium]|nr:hypothetical protein [Chloroflexota bacterium]
MKRVYLTGLMFALLVVGIAGCGLFANPTPAPPTVQPTAPAVLETEVAGTLTAVAPTAQGQGTPIPPPTQVAVATATLAPSQPTPIPPTPSGENNPPTVQWLAPSNGAQITAQQTISVVALAADDHGISRVEFYADNALYSTQPTPNLPTTYQAVFAWSSAQVGQHTLTIIAYDPSNNASAPAPATINVDADSTPPQVSILAPASPQNLTLGAQINVQVAASDEAGVTQLQMLVDSQPYSQVTSQSPSGQNPFAATFIYAANVPGTHTILVRAVDSAGNLGNSNPLTVVVADNAPPNVTTNYSRLNVRQNEQVTVYTNATDAAGIQRVELWADNALYNVFTSPNPPAQTSLALQQIWASDAPGNHVLFVRVFDVNNQSTTTPATNIFVRQPQEPTPTFTPFIPTRTPYPTRTPQPVIPPPNCQMEAPATNFRVEIPNAVEIRWNCTAQGGMAQIQVYFQYPGVMATLIENVPGNGGMEQRGGTAWYPSSPGAVDVFVVALDRLGQRGESPHIPGIVEAPRPPTLPPPPTPQPQQGITGRWRGAVDNGAFIIVLEPRIGCSETQCAYGGTFEDTRGNVRGEINGQYDGRNLTLSVQGAQPGDVTWNFEGQVTAGGNEIAGQWSEARAGVPSLQQGTVAFRRE